MANNLPGLSAHGLIIRIRPSFADPTVANEWTANQTIELIGVGDTEGIGTTRNDHEITPHDKNIDQWIFGVARRELMSFPLFYNRANSSHRALRLMQANNNVSTQMANGFEVESPDGELLIFSGGVKNMPISYPVDGPQEASVEIRASGNYILNGIEYGD